MKTPSQALYALQEKAKSKLLDTQDKIACATEISNSNLGYELTRALSGLEANKEHLRVAEELLELCRKEEDSLLGMSDTVGKSLETEQIILQNTYETNLAKLKANFERDMLALQAKYSGKVSKAAKKCSDKMSLLEQRVKRYEGAVALSLQSVERLQNNKPKAIIRAEYAAKKPERDLQFVKQVEEMNEFQASTRDKKSQHAVQNYADTVNVEPPKKREMPPETAAERAYWGTLTGVNMEELDKQRQEALDSSEMSSFATNSLFNYVSERELNNIVKQKKQIRKVGAA